MATKLLVQNSQRHRKWRVLLTLHCTYTRYYSYSASNQGESCHFGFCLGLFDSIRSGLGYQSFSMPMRDFLGEKSPGPGADSKTFVRQRPPAMPKLRASQVASRSDGASAPEQTPKPEWGFKVQLQSTRKNRIELPSSWWGLPAHKTWENMQYELTSNYSITIFINNINIYIYINITYIIPLLFHSCYMGAVQNSRSQGLYAVGPFEIESWFHIFGMQGAPY